MRIRAYLRFALLIQGVVLRTIQPVPSQASPILIMWSNQSAFFVYYIFPEQYIGYFREVQCYGVCMAYEVTSVAMLKSLQERGPGLIVRVTVVPHLNKFTEARC